MNPGQQMWGASFFALPALPGALARLLLDKRVMRRALLLFLLLGLPTWGVAALAPMTAKEIGLMLRSGYSVEAVEQDLAARHFIEAIDPAAEKALVRRRGRRRI